MNIPISSLRHLHLIGVDHTHDLFDADINHHNETVPVEGLDYSDDNTDTAERENNNRTISMYILFSILIIVYLSFCSLYNRQKIYHFLFDSIHPDSALDSRDQRRNVNRAVLDESTDVSNRARRDVGMARRLEERREKIHRVLTTRLIVDEGFREEGVRFKVADGVGDDVDLLHDLNTSAKVTKSDERESSTSDEETTEAKVDEGTSNKPVGNTESTRKNEAMFASKNITTASCVDLKQRISNSLANCGNSAHCNTNNNTCLDSWKHSTIEDTVLTGEECNICLSEFQVGDRIACSRNNISDGKVKRQNVNDSVRNVNNDDMMCCHIFHAECIERWLLVRDACPVCRRSYFDGLDQINEEIQPVDLERGNTDTNAEGVSYSTNIAVPTRVVAV